MEIRTPRSPSHDKNMLLALRRILILAFLSYVSFFVGYFSSMSFEAKQNGSNSHLRQIESYRSRIMKHAADGEYRTDEDLQFFRDNCFRQDGIENVTTQSIFHSIRLEVQKQVASLMKLDNPTPIASDRQPFFPPMTNSKSISGMVRISKQQIMQQFDNFGVAILDTQSFPAREDDEALLLYNHIDSVPGHPNFKEEATRGIQYAGSDDANQKRPNPSGLAKIDNMTLALEHCDALNVQFVHNPSGSGLPMCHLWIPSHDLPSYHVNRWMRIGENTNELRHVPHLLNAKGVNKMDVPRYHPLISKHWKVLERFFNHVDDVVQDLRTIIEARLRVLRDVGPEQHSPGKNTIIVMTVNQGQSDLLTNFLCAARARDLDVSRVIVFVSDEETKFLVEGMSLDLEDHLRVMVYYDERNMADLPKGGEGVKYGDATFTSMMLAKILCVLYVSLLGYDILFQDVDIVWYKSPLLFFHSHDGVGKRLVDEYDIIFQHDGSPQQRYAPYSANSGFFFVKSNSKTKYLLTSMLYHGDLVRKTSSHQQVFNHLLLEHSSLMGLRVKVMDQHDIKEFPGGDQYQHDNNGMHRIFSGQDKPFLFHMFWTDGHASKLKFLRQMGGWFVNDACLGHWVTSFASDLNLVGSLSGRCCSVEPLVTCHYRDKPSIIPCNDSPFYDKNAKPFW
mmetsp:Transcript_26431/g.54489  ORF Transcript_26431/g.54489 Transcript_26431/m.54489 type:complete len:675 (+) Transcript_26431:140-2164(+)